MIAEAASTYLPDRALVDGNELGPGAALGVARTRHPHPIARGDPHDVATHRGHDAGRFEPDGAREAHVRRDEVPIVDSDPEGWDRYDDLIGFSGRHANLGELDGLIYRIQPDVGPLERNSTWPALAPGPFEANVSRPTSKARR